MNRVPLLGNWDCGYIAPTSRIQYTGSSFGQMLTDLFGWVLWPRKTIVVLRGLFPRRGRIRKRISRHGARSRIDPGILDERVFSSARRITRGTVQLYLVYILIALLALLIFAAWR